MLPVLGFAALGVTPLLRADSEEPLRPKGLHNNSVHRFFPDLDGRFNAVRYGRWRALEIAWLSGINQRLDQEFSSYLLAVLSEPPRFPPEADRVAPRLARGAAPIFRALQWGQMLEQQSLDALAAADATPSLTERRLDRALSVYRRERYALAEPGGEAGPLEAIRLAPVSARILLSGTALFVRAAEDLADLDFGQQRWRVKKTIAEFDRSLAEGGPSEASTYKVSAPRVSSVYPQLAEHLDRLLRFRMEVFEALVPGGGTPQARRERDLRLKEVARRYQLPSGRIGED